MSATLTIVQTTTELGIEMTEVILESSSTPGPAGPGVPAGGTDGQVLTKTSATDYATAWEDPTGGGGASAAEDVTFTPAGNLASTDVQSALEELDQEKAAASHTHAQSDVTNLVSDLAGKQPVDSDLTAIAALSTTAFGRGLLELANQAALLSAAGAAAASHTHAQSDITNLVSDLAAKQPLDSDLTAIAALSTTAFGRSLLTLADAAALLAAAGAQPADATLDTYAGIDPSANVQSILGAANYAAIRTLLGLVIGTNVQAWDADLDTYAGITPSANVQSLLGAADYAAIRTLLGLVVGTNVQAWDADLDTYAGITPSANVQSLLAAANYAAMRALLDLEAGTDFPSQATFADHSARHENGGDDELNVAGLSGELADAQPVAVHKNGTLIGTRSNINLIEGTNVTLTVSDDAGDDEVDVTIAASGGSATADDESLVLHIVELA